jgi:Ca2+-binding RTX toxin-like protein
VSVEDSIGDVVIGDTSNVTAALTNSAGAVLGGTLTEAAVNGVATFSNLLVNSPGTYALTVTDGSLTAATSTPFTVSQPASFATLSNGALVISGTSGDDTITLTVSGSNLLATLNGVSSSPIALGSITSIDVEGEAGNDLITLGAGVPGASVQGGPGDDSIVGGAGADTLGGGTGNDTILGDAGNDSIRGGAGDDTLGGGQGDDSILGSLGNDTITGGAGNDILIGGAGSNVVHGGLGDDTIFAINGAADTLYGGAGNDTAHIDQGLDQIPNNDIETVLFT